MPSRSNAASSTRQSSQSRRQLASDAQDTPCAIAHNAKRWRVPRWGVLSRNPPLVGLRYLDSSRVLQKNNCRVTNQLWLNCAIR